MSQPCILVIAQQVNWFVVVQELYRWFEVVPLGAHVPHTSTTARPKTGARPAQGSQN